MANVKLNPFTCPVCGNGSVMNVEIDEDTIKNAERLPKAVTAKCNANHIIVLYVDGNFKIRDIEAALNAAEDAKDSLDQTEEWLSGL
ncbi:MAG: hypothetical protein ACFFAY_11985 [Promethearchaeota archaeon]